jgi:hypothetical protein
MMFLVDYKLKIIIGWSAKCGCTHIKHIFEYFIAGVNKTSSDIHSTIQQYTTTLPHDIQNYHVVMILRNPFDRIVSGFLDKYKKGGPLRNNWPNDTITFSQFVHQVIQRNWAIVDYHHFCPQTEEYFNPNVFKAKTCKLFDLTSIDYRYLENMFRKKIPNNLIEHKGNHTRKSSTQTWTTPVYDVEMDTYINYNVDYSLFYNDDLKKKVYKFYYNDFILCSHIKDTPPPLRSFKRLMFL